MREIADRKRQEKKECSENSTKIFDIFNTKKRGKLLAISEKINIFAPRNLT